MNEKTATQLFNDIKNLLHNNKVDEALAMAGTALQLFPEEAEGYFWYAESCDRNGDTTGAIEHLQKACALQPYSVGYLGRLAEHYLLTEQLDLAKRYYTSVLELESVTWAYIGLGNVFERLFDIPQTIECFKKAIRLMGQGKPPINLFNRLISLQEKNHDIIGQIDSLNQLIALLADAPIKYDYLCTLGQLYSVSGEVDDAVGVYLQAIACDAHQVTAYANLANIYQMLGKADDELDILQKATASVDDAYLQQRLKNLAHRSNADSKKFIRKPLVIAYYLPQFHEIAENNQWWGEGFTEWNNVTTGKPAFGGHLQPRRPAAMGYYDLRVPETVNKQFKMAQQYGVDAFCYYYYWFNGHRLLERPLNDLLEGKTGPFPFCICWVNEEWTRSWDGMSGEVLMPLEHTPENDFAFIKDCLPILKHPGYVRADNKPMLLVYRADKLSNPKETTQMWRNYCKDNGLPDIYLCAVQSFGFDDPASVGFDAAVEFPPHALWDKHPGLRFYSELEPTPYMYSEFNGKVYNYQHFADCAIARPKEPYPLHRACMLAWDNSARRGKSAHIYHYFSVGKYERWLTENVSKSIQELSEPIVFVNAWNEWAEGSYLEPDEFFGYELLEATRRAKQKGLYKSFDTYWSKQLPQFPDNRLAQKERIVMVGHDAYFSGAQINLMHMARCLRRTLGLEVVIFLLEGGELLAEYEKIGTVIVLGSQPGWQDTARGYINHYAAMGTTKAICNTVVTGEVVGMLKDAHYRVCSLVHELPALIAEYGLEGRCELLAEKADNVVFASSVVGDAFCERYNVSSDRVLLAPQGISFNPYLKQQNEHRDRLRAELNLAADTKIVMSCGYGDTRKGIDLFVQMAAIVRNSLPGQNIAFVWVGRLQDQLATYIYNDVKRLGLGNAFHVTGKVDDTAHYYIASEVFALTSREDPFPSVVMEAFDGKLPVVAFNGGGGYVDIVGPQSGALVPYLDVQKFAEAVIDLLRDDDKRQAIGERNHQFCRSKFGYEPYMRKLLALLSGKTPATLSRDPELPRLKVSVIVPNYNYAHYLELRLRTILDQSLPPDELIILDDASTDDSVSLIEAMMATTAIAYKIIRNEYNSGNVFHQWELGMQAASGDLIWIAEADDYCEPGLLEKLAAYFDDDSVVMAYADSIMVDEQGKSEGCPYKNYYGTRQPGLWHESFCMEGSALLKKCLLTENVVPNASAVLFRRNAIPSDLPTLKKYRFSGDWWFWIGIAEQGKVAYWADPLNYHRRHVSSVMGDVLKQGEKLLPETIAFYQRLIVQKHQLIDEETILHMNDWLETLYGYFPELLAEADKLENHPKLSPLLSSLRTSLSMTEKE